MLVDSKTHYATLYHSEACKVGILHPDPLWTCSVTSHIAWK